MLSRINRGCVIAILPERTPAIFPFIVCLGRSPRDKLDTLRNRFLVSGVVDKKVGVVAGYTVVKNTEPEPFARFTNPTGPGASILLRPQKKSTVVAAVGKVPDMTGDVVTIGTGHGSEYTIGEERKTATWQRRVAACGAWHVLGEQGRTKDGALRGLRLYGSK